MEFIKLDNRYINLDNVTQILFKQKEKDNKIIFNFSNLISKPNISREFIPAFHYHKLENYTQAQTEFNKIFDLLINTSMISWMSFNQNDCVRLINLDRVNSILEKKEGKNTSLIFNFNSSVSIKSGKNENLCEYSIKVDNVTDEDIEQLKEIFLIS